MTTLNARGKVTLLSSIFVFVLVFVIAIAEFYNLNLTRYNERIKGHMHAFELTVQLVAEKLSFGYFQWTEFYDAVTEEKADFIQENFDEILDRSKYISSIPNYALRRKRKYRSLKKAWEPSKLVVKPNTTYGGFPCPQLIYHNF
ncbi:hypothetical protein [Kosmotoga sp. DU53]|uniref:hypothetical protein n=1 Tax=Kosmotoga sp. DU53 TaxID=1310160 RepID=UPI0007C4DB23|nr:hypothetical protein [Kosmotoga sp. DU53]OAA20951.1 hypothetical protein DU53_06950 [Kosmotoga sp. DU53]